ncbi:MAG: hypothetical protein ACJAWK_001828 [Candidatus Azotimanducaceae bacterium]
MPLRATPQSMGLCLDTHREPVVLETLSAISTRLYWSKPIAMLLGFVFVSLFVLSILDVRGFDTKNLLIPSLLGALWSAIYFILLTIFPSVPASPGKEVSLFTRIKVRFQRGMYYLLGITLIVLTIGIFFLSFKLLGIWRAEF